MNIPVNIPLIMVSVPFIVWMIVIVIYPLAMFTIYIMGLPFKKIDRRSYTEKNVSHGIISTLRKVHVYDTYYTEANAITLIGVIGLIIILYLITTDTWTTTIPFLFLSAAVVSDLLDGKACKRHDCHSKIGAWLDPIRDRLTLVVIITSIVMTIGYDNLLWLIPVVYIAFFEIHIACIARNALRQKRVLNSHGAGEKRQVAHLIMIEILLVSYYMLPLGREIHEFITVLSLLIMAFASAYAFMHYKRLYDRP